MDAGHRRIVVTATGEGVADEPLGDRLGVLMRSGTMLVDVTHQGCQIGRVCGICLLYTSPSPRDRG